MRRRSRTRRVLKWVGTVACLLVAATFLLSGWWLVDLQHGRVFVGLGMGGLNVADAKQRRQHYFRCDVQRHKYGFRFWNSVGRMPSQPRELGFSMKLPLWVLFVVAVIPTWCLWWSDRHPFTPGHCQKCGYDLTGNVSGRCPECGTVIEREHE
jgi:hypothetical protein